MRLIDADTLREQVESHVTTVSVCLSVDESRGKYEMKEECLSDIDNAPTVRFAYPKNTRFIRDADRDYRWHCEACLFTTGIEWRFYNFCPQCGSVIKKEQEGC